MAELQGLETTRAGPPEIEERRRKLPAGLVEGVPPASAMREIMRVFCASASAQGNKAVRMRTAASVTRHMRNILKKEVSGESSLTRRHVEVYVFIMYFSVSGKKK